MNDCINIYCQNIGTEVQAHGGETLQELAARLAPQLGDLRPISALVNNKNEPLQYRIFGPKQVKFVGIDSASGSRVYVRTLCMMLYAAVRKELPQWRLRIEHSIAGGYYCLMGRVNPEDGKPEPFPIDKIPQAIEKLEAAMRRMVQQDLPLTYDEGLTKDLIGEFARQNQPDKVQLLESIHQLYTTYYSLDGTIDSYYGPLAPSTGMMATFELKPYHHGFLLMPPGSANPTAPATITSQEKMYKAYVDSLHFNRVIGISDVGQLNDAVKHQRSADLINVAEALHDKRIAAIADEIAERYRRGGARIVLVAGPSSSGKTTTTKRLGIYLTTNMLSPKMISLDDYFINRVNTPRDEYGDYDFESLYALDLEQFNADLNALLEGREVSLPSYNFERGERQYKGKKLCLDDNSILLIEGIHGLNPALTASISEEMKFRVYVSALTTLSIDDHNWIPTTDNRLLRRIIRDYKYRGISAVESIRRWPSVSRGEEKWIFPYQENADATFNSSLLFELGVMKDYAEQILRDVPNDLPEYAEAYRLRRFLSYFASIGERGIPPTSLLREFLGGSSFRY